jgi:hypothetical protein
MEALEASVRDSKARRSSSGRKRSTKARKSA